MIDNNTKTDKLNKGNQNSIITDPVVSGTNTVPNTNTIPENTKPSKPVYNIQNLKPYNKTDNILSSEEAKRRGRNGAKKSAEARRQRKTMKETLDAILSRDISTQVLTDNGIDLESLNGDYSALNVLLTQIVAEGIANRDFRAAAFIRDTIGEQPINRQEITQEIITKDDLDMMENVRKQLLSS